MTEKVTFKTGISLPPSLHARAVQRSKSVSGGKFARYVQQLITNDLNGELPPSTHQTDIIEQLTKVYEGWLTPDLATVLRSKKVNQPRLIAALLPAILEHVQRAQNDRQLYNPTIQFADEWLDAHPVYPDPQPGILAVAEDPPPSSGHSVEEKAAHEARKRDAKPAAANPKGGATL